MELAIFQREVEAWTAKNFLRRSTHHGLLGIVEECGALNLLHEPTAVRNKLGDVVIFAAAYVSAVRLDLVDIYERSILKWAGSPVRNAFVSSLGTVCRAQLRVEQGASPDRHRAEIRDGLIELFVSLLAVSTFHNFPLLDALESRWIMVRTRSHRCIRCGRALGKHGFYCETDCQAVTP